MGKPFLINPHDAETRLTAIGMLLRFRPGLPHVTSVASEARNTLRQTAVRTAAIHPTSPVTVDFDEGRIYRINPDVTDITDAHRFTILTKPSDIKNLCMLACEDHGIDRRRFRRNWTTLRKHIREHLKEESSV